MTLVGNSRERSVTERRRATRRKRAEFLLGVLPPMSIFAGPWLGSRHADRWRGPVWKSSPRDVVDYRRNKR